MIKVNTSETFPITVALLDENTGVLAPGRTVSYDVRDTSDNPLSPPINGTLTESSVEPGIYKTNLTIPTEGKYIFYASCGGFMSNTEEIIVEDNLHDLVKQERHYNLSVENVNRTNATPTASQTTRNVPMYQTDYVITKIKSDDASDWSDPVATSIVYAWYETDTAVVPYKMGGPN